MLETHKTNAYAIESPNETKMVYQTPWYHDGGAFGGLVEITMIVPKEMPHFVRSAPAPPAEPSAEKPEQSSITTVDPALAMPVFYTLEKLTS